MKNTIIIILSIIGLFVFIFLIGLYSLGWNKFFLPKQENIRRQVFEETQSYVHGKIQDLAKYYDEYIKSTDPQEKESIRQIIIMRFSEFDTQKIKNNQLKNFLIQQRGY